MRQLKDNYTVKWVVWCACLWVVLVTTFYFMHTVIVPFSLAIVVNITIFHIIGVVIYCYIVIPTIIIAVMLFHMPIKERF